MQIHTSELFNFLNSLIWGVWKPLRAAVVTTLLKLIAEQAITKLEASIVALLMDTTIIFTQGTIIVGGVVMSVYVYNQLREKYFPSWPEFK